MSLDQIPIKLFADGADLKGITEYYHKPYIAGLTTNPTLMRKAGINDYEKFSRAALEIVRTKPSPWKYSPMTSRKCVARP